MAPVRSPALLCFAGAVTALVGLAWDISIHAANPSLVHESAFDILNPALDLIAAGVAVAAISSAWLVAVVFDRRLAMVAVAILLALAAWVGASLAFTPAPDSGATAAERAKADQLWRSTQASTRRYESLAAATSAGYVAFNPIGDPLVHYVNPVYMHDGRILDPDAVESLVYASTLRGPVLVAAMYSLESAAATPPDVAGKLTVWHRHDDLCFEPDGEPVAAGPACPAGSTTRNTPWMLHVWFVPDRYGRFAADIDPWNELEIELLA